MKKTLFVIVLLAGASRALAMDFESLGFMAGCWESMGVGESTEECWMPPRANLLVGMGRAVKGMHAEWEFLRVENRKEGITLVAQPRGGAATEFRAVKLTTTEVVFENARHDFPQRLRYWRDGDRLRARVEDLSGKRGFDFTWTRRKEAP